jgi:glycosyltransferase involved in cell wall biosynthesis
MDLAVLQPPGGDHAAGGGAFITGLIAALRSAGHDCVVETGTALPPGRVALIDGLGLSRFDPDAVREAVAIVHHPAAMADSDKAAVHQAELAILPQLRGVVATSHAIAERLQAEFGVAPDRVRVVQPGVPDVPRATGSGGPGCAILSIGALVPRKGHAVLLRALARLFDLDWRLTIAGDDTRDPVCAAALREQAASCGIAARVRFAGTLDAAALDAAWHSADMFALATEWEGYAAPVAEALRRGLPVAITRSGAAAELVTPDIGVICEPGEVDQLSKAMRRMIFDSGLRADMAEAAWQAGQALPDWPAQAARFVEAIS